MRWPDFITFFRQHHSLAKSIKNDAVYINQRKLKEEFIINLAPLNKYPLFVQKLFLNDNFKKIITEITGEFEEAQNHLNLTQLITTTNNEENF